MLLPAASGAMILRWVAGDCHDLPQPGFLARLGGRTSAPDRAVQALRGQALARARGMIHSLGRKARQQLGQGATYLNVGHANWRREVFAGLAALHRVVLIHDMIPLDHPEFTRKGQSLKFRDRFAVAATLSDLIVTISEASRERIEFWRKRAGVRRRVPIIVAQNGTRLVAPDVRDLPADLDLTRPFFICLGTIEPRKNHAVLLDAWAEMAKAHPGQALPQLFIIGRRGWENQETFARLDLLPKGGPIVEMNGLDDGAVAALLLRSHGLVMPSLAEGFGLPLSEAACRGVPVLTTPLPSSKEVLGSWATYLEPDQPQAWAQALYALSQQPARRLPALQAPDWDEHIATVSGALLQLSD